MLTSSSSAYICLSFAVLKEIGRIVVVRSNPTVTPLGSGWLGGWPSEEEDGGASEVEGREGGEVGEEGGGWSYRITVGRRVVGTNCRHANDGNIFVELGWVE